MSLGHGGPPMTMGEIVAAEGGMPQAPAKPRNPQNYRLLLELEARWQNAERDLVAARKLARTYRTRFLLLVPAVGVVAWLARGFW